MAVCLKLKDIPMEYFQTIINSLTLIPTEKEEPFFKKKQNFYTTPKDPIVMYHIENDNIYLPYRYACSLFNTIFNHNKNHLKIINNHQPEFKAMLRDYQVPQALKSLEYVKAYSTVTLGLPPGEGKTMLGSWLIYMLELMFLVIVPREKLIGQWWETFNKSIPAIASRIYRVGEPYNSSLSPVGFICMDTRIHLIPKEYKPFIGTIIYDEIHMLCTPSSVKTLLPSEIEPKYMIAETATLERNDGMHTMAQTIVGMHGIFKISDKPYKVYRINTDVMVEETSGKRGLDFTDLIKKLAADNLYNYVILNIIKTNLQHKYIILTRLAEHANNLCTWLRAMGISADTLVGSKNNYNDSKVLIGTIGKISTGFDEENACPNYEGIRSNVLIITPSVKEYQLFEQSRGRVMRSNNPIVVWISPKNKVINNHFYGLKNWISETNGEIITQKFVDNQTFIT
jgi:superfamily II DNA or RNA helicase